MHCRMVSSIPNLYLLDPSHASSPQTSTVAAQNVSRHCQECSGQGAGSEGGQNCHQLKMTGLAIIKTPEGVAILIKHTFNEPVSMNT